MRRTRCIWTMVAVVLILGAALGAVATGTAQAGSIVVLPRPGQVGVSGNYLYGTLLDNGNVGSQFGSGPGMAVRIRYRMRYERAFGLSFEGHGLDPRPGKQTDIDDRTTQYDPSDPLAYKRLNLYLSGVDFYQMFGTRTKLVKMLSVGGGLAHPIFNTNNGDTLVPMSFGDGAYLGFGAGAERFFWQSMAFDFGARYQAVFLDGKVNHDLQASVGLIYYASL
jgi:hypothetical protein